MNLSALRDAILFPGALVAVTLSAICLVAMVLAPIPNPITAAIFTAVFLVVPAAAVKAQYDSIVYRQKLADERAAELEAMARAL